MVGAAYNHCLVGADFQFLCGAGKGVLSLCVCVCVCARARTCEHTCLCWN